MKKILLTSGAILSLSAPVIGAVSCTFIKQDKMGDFVELPNLTNNKNIFADSTMLNLAINQQKNGINFAINNSMAAYNANKGEVVGLLPYRSNSNGIILADGWTEKDVDMFSKIFQELSWFNDQKEIAEGYNIPYVNTSTPNHVKDFLNELNIKHGLSHFKNSTFKSFVNGEVKELSSWSHNNQEEPIYHELSLDSDSKEIIEKENPTHEELAIQKQEIKAKIDAAIRRVGMTKTLDGTTLTAEPSRLSIKPLSNQDSRKQDVYDFYFYYVKGEEADKKRYHDVLNDYITTDPINATDQVRAWEMPWNTFDSNEIRPTYKYDMALNSLTRFFKAAGINIRIHATNNISELNEKANSSEKAFVYMPVDSWAQNRKGGSLIYQARRETTVADSIFDINKLEFEAPSIEVEEGKTLNFIQDYTKTFSDLYSQNKATIESVSESFDTLRDRAQNRNGIDTASFANALGSSSYFKNGIQTAVDIATSWNTRRRFEEYPKLVDGNIEYINPTYYTQYQSKFVVSDFSSKGNATAKLFMDQIAKFGPSIANEFEWEINTRESLPLPIYIGTLRWDGENLNDNIMSWINNHFKI